VNDCDTLLTNTVDFFPMFFQLIKTSRLSDLSRCLSTYALFHELILFEKTEKE